MLTKKYKQTPHLTNLNTLVKNYQKVIKKEV